MTPLKHKVSKALEEVRMLVLGSQILLGFKFHSAFHPGFEALPPHARWLMALSLATLLTAFALLLMPTPFHRVAGVAITVCLLGAWFLLPVLMRGSRPSGRTATAPSAGE